MRLSWAVLHRLGLVAEDRLDGLVRVVDGEQLEHVGAAVALVAVELVDTGTRVEVAGAVEADRTTSSPMSTALNLASAAKMSTRWSISAAESGGALARRAPISRAGLDVVADLARRHLDQRAVAEPRPDRPFHSRTSAASSLPTGGEAPPPANLVSYITNWYGRRSRRAGAVNVPRRFGRPRTAGYVVAGARGRVWWALTTADGRRHAERGHTDQRSHARPRADRRAHPGRRQVGCSDAMGSAPSPSRASPARPGRTRLSSATTSAARQASSRCSWTRCCISKPWS